MALFANPLDDFFLDAIHGFPGFPHVGCRPAKRHRRASSHPFAAHRHPFYYAIPARAGSPAAPADAAPTRDATPAVEETDRGFLVTARLPGVRADAVRVEAAPARRAGRGDVLRLRAEGLEADLKLPTAGLVDVDNIIASCLDGVLRVVVPKVMPTTEPVPVRAGPGPAADEEASDEAHATKRRSIALDVPGYAPVDIAIHRERPGDVLVVKGAKDASRRLGGFERRFRVGEPLARVDATCADGVLTVRVSEPEPAPEVLVPIDAPDASETTPKEDGEHAAAAAEAAEASAIEVFRRALPGVPASAYAIAADADDGAGFARLRVRVETPRSAYAFAARLPEGTDRNTLRARVADGIVVVTAAKAEKPAPRTVPVRGDRHADFAAVEGDAEAAEKETAPAKIILEGDAENIAEE
jgi:HSP20 family molecular chaperone IbpA